MIRYWVGLQDPTKSYNNLLENHTGGPTDNMYVLYRAQFQPYMETKKRERQHDRSSGQHRFVCDAG